MVPTCDLSPQEAESGGWKVQSQVEPHSNEFHADLSYPKTVGFEHRNSAQSKGRIHRVRLDTLD